MLARISDPELPLHERLVVGGWVLVFVAVPWLLLGGGSAATTARFLATAEQGIAEAVSSRENPSSRGSSTWMTTFSLIAPDGARLTARWTGENGLAPGEAVRVRYRREPLVRIQPDNQRAAWIWAWVLGGAGCARLLLGGALVLTGTLLRRRAQASG